MEISLLTAFAMLPVLAVAADERFYKADEARSKTSAGLGLSIAREFAKRMHGGMWAETEGALFRICASFPLLPGQGFSQGN